MTKGQRKRWKRKRDGEEQGLVSLKQGLVQEPFENRQSLHRCFILSSPLHKIAFFTTHQTNSLPAPANRQASPSSLLFFFFLLPHLTPLAASISFHNVYFPRYSFDLSRIVREKFENLTKRKDNKQSKESRRLQSKRRKNIIFVVIFRFLRRV